MACSLSALSFFDLPAGLGAGLVPGAAGGSDALGRPPSSSGGRQAPAPAPAAAAGRRACATCARPLSARCSFCAAPDAFVCDGCCAECDGCGKGACGACQAARFAACERCAYASCDECRIQPGAGGLAGGLEGGGCAHAACIFEPAAGDCMAAIVCTTTITNLKKARNQTAPADCPQTRRWPTTAAARRTRGATATTERSARSAAAGERGFPGGWVSGCTGPARDKASRQPDASTFSNNPPKPGLSAASGTRRSP
jgi:hypothetical protein